MNLFNLITNFVNDALGKPHFKSEKKQTIICKHDNTLCIMVHKLLKVLLTILLSIML